MYSNYRGLNRASDPKLVFTELAMQDTYNEFQQNGAIADALKEVHKEDPKATKAADDKQ